MDISDKSLWYRLNDGRTPGQIKKNGRVHTALDSLVSVIDDIESGSSDGILLPPEVCLLPLNVPDSVKDDGLALWNHFNRYKNMSEEEFQWHYSHYHVMRSEEFRRYGMQFTLKEYRNKNDAVKGPQEMMVDAIKRVKLEGLDKVSVGYQLIARRGFKWDKRGGKSAHAILGLRDLMRGWNLASILINEGYPFSYSNPPSGFWINLPKTHAPVPIDPNKAQNQIRMSGFVTEPSNHYDWQMISGDLMGSENAGKDMATEVGRYMAPEWNVEFRFVASSILRQHVNDERRRKYHIHEPRNDWRMDPVELNIALVPTDYLVGYYHKLMNNVLIGRRKVREDGGYEVMYRKPLVGELDALISLAIYEKGHDDCFFIDEGLERIDSTINKFITKQEALYPIRRKELIQRR